MRELTGTDAQPPSQDPEPTGVPLVAGEKDWTVRVLGRSGGGSRGRPPLLLLGFWPAEEADGPHVLESTVVARTLAGLSPARLETALARAAPPPDPERGRSFFEGASRGRRR